MTHGTTHFPLTADSISPAFLNEIAGIEGVVSVRVSALESQGLTASLVRLSLEQRAGDPLSLIAKTSAADPATRAKFSAFYAREVTFYRDVVPAGYVSSPVCHFAQCRGDQHLLLLEDLHPAQAGDIHLGVSAGQAQAFIEQIASVHAHWWESPHLKALRPRLPPFGGSFVEGYSRALSDAAAFLAPYASAATTRLAHRLQTDLEQRWNAQWLAPQTVIQWDAHAANVLYPPDEPGAAPARLVDWQNCAVGQGIWDIARFCVVSLPIEERRKHERDLVAAYVALLRDRGVNASLQTLWATYRLLMPVMFAQQFRFLAAFTGADGTLERQAWADAVMPRVIAALHDAM